MSDTEPRVADTGVTETPVEPNLPAAGPAPAIAPEPPLLRPVDYREQAEAEFGEVQDAGAFYAAMLLPVLAAVGWRYHTGSDAREVVFWASGAMYAVIAGFAIAWRRDWLHLLRLPSGDANRWLVWALVVPVVTITAARLLQAWATRVGFPVQDIGERLSGGGYTAWALALLIVVLAPVFEEIAFRGLLLAKLQKVMRPWQAIWVSAALFALIHFSVLSMPVFLVPLAVAAGYVTREAKSLLPAIAMHAAHNAGVVFLGLVNV